MSLPEQRFKENSGERYLESGKVRCHALAKSKVRQWRDMYNDYDTPTEDLWPECQCKYFAEEGQYVCRFHGGKTPRTVSAPRSILDFMPLEMAEKYKALMDSPDYISRKEDINLFRVRVRMLLEDLSREADADESWGLVHEAIVKLKKGDSLDALAYLEEATKTVTTKQKIWDEIAKTEKLLGDMTNTQMKTVKDLQSMATVEQVNALISTLINLINTGAQNYIPDPVNRNQFTRTIVAEMERLMGLTPQKMLIDATE